MESFGSIFGVPKEKRTSFMIYGANNKSQAKLLEKLKVFF